jgi:C-terminal binding protein
VAILDNQFVDEEFIPDIEKGVLEGVATVDCLGAHKVEEIPDRVKDAEAILAWHHITNIGKEALQKFEKTKVIVRIGMGYDNVDIKAAGELGIRVCNVPDYGVEEVADSAVCMMLNLMRMNFWLTKGTKEGNWPTKSAHGATRLAGRTVGIVGLGRIGTAFALRCKSFNLKVVFF